MVFSVSLTSTVAIYIKDNSALFPVHVLQRVLSTRVMCFSKLTTWLRVSYNSFKNLAKDFSQNMNELANNWKGFREQTKIMNGKDCGCSSCILKLH